MKCSKYPQKDIFAENLKNLHPKNFTTLNYLNIKYISLMPIIDGIITKVNPIINIVLQNPCHKL